MIESLEAHVEAVRGLVVAMEPASLAPAEARQLLELAGAIERLGTALKLAVTPRALVGAPWGEEGFRSPSAWLAEQLRTSQPQAVVVMDTAQELEQLPALAEAVRAGSLSGTEAAAVCHAASADPVMEADLLEAAQSMAVHELLRYSRICAQAAHERQPGHRARMTDKRYLNAWSDAEGMFRFSAALLPEDGMHLLGQVRSMAAHLGSEARRAGESPSDKALAADALVALVLGDRRWATFSGPHVELAPRADLVLVMELSQLEAGGGPRCHLAGVGSVPCKAVESVLGEGLLATVVKDGVDVVHVTHHGRFVPAHLRTALEVRDPRCVVPECEAEVGLEIDHWQIPFAQGGATALWNLCRICSTHHRMKTYDGYVLAGGPGKWEWRPPD